MHYHNSVVRVRKLCQSNKKRLEYKNEVENWRQDVGDGKYGRGTKSMRQEVRGKKQEEFPASYLGILCNRIDQLNNIIYNSSQQTTNRYRKYPCP